MVEEYFGKPLEPFQPLPEFKYEDFLGWNEQGWQAFPGHLD